jgi:aldehyde:ferredoxin oxidoreductase
MVLDRKIALINLAGGSTEIVPISLDLRKKFLGGRGINMYLLFLFQSYSHALPVFGEKAYHCNLCSGNPQCIKVCTPKAISV